MGKEVGRFNLPRGEYSGTPVVTKNIVLLPVIGKGYTKLYFLWNGLIKINELTFVGEEWMPKISTAYGKIYVVLVSKDKHKILKLIDDEKPEIINVSQGIEKEEIPYRTHRGIWSHTGRICNSSYR